MIAINDIKKKYGNEVALIILCCRVFIETATLFELTAFVGDNNIEWEKFMQLSKMHRVRPIVYKIIYQTNTPPKIKLAISSEYSHTIKLNFQQAIETERVILLLQKNNVEVAPYKGVYFSKQFFGDFTSRESSDIDLIIKPQYLNQAIAVLKKDGYQPELDDIYQHLGKSYFSYFKDYNLDKFIQGKRIFHIELHWAIVEKEIGVNNKVNSFLFQLDGEVPELQDGIKILPALSHFSAVLIHHCFKDNLKFLKNIIDIGQAIKQPEIQQNTLILNKRFKELGLQKALAISNGLCWLLLGTALPQVDEVKTSGEVVDYFINEMCSTNTYSPGNDKSRMSLWFKNTSLLQGAFIQKVKFYWTCWSFRFIPGRFDFRLVQLPSQLFFVYYFIKPFRTLAKLIGVSEIWNKRT